MYTVQRLLVGLVLLATTTLAHAVRITPAHSGSWFDPVYDMQGFAFEVLDKLGNGPERLVAVHWYTYGDAGEPVWAVGLGRTNRNVVELMMQRTVGGARSPTQGVTGTLIDWATIRFTFGNCHLATAVFTMVDSGQTGTYNLRRLTHIGPSSCTGGISDDVDPAAEPVTIVRQLSPGVGFADAQGKVTLKLRPAYAEFEIDVQKLPAGSYEVRVDGTAMGSVVVTVNGNGNGIGKGTLTFRSPPGATDILLDFDPRGSLIEIVNGVGAVGLFTNMPL